MRALAAALVMVSAPAMAQTEADLVGLYDGGQTEVAAGLELTPDGHFRYAMSYGAADESAEGRWRVENGKLYLDTEPEVVPPAFAVESDEPAADGALHVEFADTGFDWGTPLGVLVSVEGSALPYMTHADETGRVMLDPSWRVTGIVPAVPVYPIVPAMHPLKPGQGRRLRFRFEPNDIGRADFRGEPLTIEKGELLLERFDRTLRFRKVEDEAGEED